MKERITQVLLSAVVLLIVCLLIQPFTVLPSAWAQSPIRWEYAELSYVHSHSNGQTYFRWEGPKGTSDADSYANLAKKLGSASTRDDSTSILNYLGSQGWELGNVCIIL